MIRVMRPDLWALLGVVSRLFRIYMMRYRAWAQNCDTVSANIREQNLLKCKKNSVWMAPLIVKKWCGVTASLCIEESPQSL